MGKTNRVTLIGNLGDDIKLHHFEGVGVIGNVSLATTEVYKNKAGDKVDSVEWHNLKFFGKGAEIMEKYTQKGSLLCVHGRLTYRKYEKDGHKFTIAEIKVEDFEFLSSSKNNDNSGQIQNIPPTPPIEDDDSGPPF